MIFSTESKGVEYFVENFDLDLFSFFEQYYAFANRTHATYKKKYPQIEEESLNKQVCDLIQILEDICRGLYDLHSQNLLHNDIKPENILIKRDQNGFITKISDFDFLTTIEEGLYLTELLGSHGYLRDSEYARSIETDLFSLARTIDNQMRSDLPSPSFVEVFDILEELTKTKFKEESLKISMVKTKLIELACQLSYGTIQEGETVFPDLRNIIKLLQEMKQPFL
jgi:serine/threonine protein kinase